MIILIKGVLIFFTVAAIINLISGYISCLRDKEYIYDLHSAMQIIISISIAALYILEQIKL